MYKVLSIAGFDGSGGAGLQADLKTFSALGCYGMNVLTALPVQNTTGVKSCYAIPHSAIVEQLDAIFSDIVPDAIKIGMLFNTEIINIVASYLQQHAPKIPLVLDPVMMAKSGDPLLLPEAILTLKQQLLPLATIITPNIPEAKTLSEIDIATTDDMLYAAQTLLAAGAKAVLLKGGHRDDQQSDDLLLSGDGTAIWLAAERIHTKNTHGTGCTLSAAIAAGLALNLTLLDSCKLAKRYLHNALLAAADIKLGAGAGPVHHFYHMWPTISQI